MPFELLDTMKNTYGMTFASRGLNSIFCNKIYTTIILTIIIIILIIIIYPCKKGTPFWIVGKLGIYIFMAVLVVLFVHNGVVYSAHKNDSSLDDTEEFVGSLGGDGNIAFNKDNVDVKPAFGGGSDNSKGNTKETSYYTSGGGSSDSIFEMYGV
jgi:hypothetical protein